MEEDFYLDVEGCDNIEEILVRKKTIISTRILKVIDISFNQGLYEMTAFIIKDPESTGMEYIFTIKKPDWLSALDSCLEHFLEIEEYEMCSYTKDLIDRISTDFTGHPSTD